MVLGVMPIAGSTIVLAKLAAIAAFLGAAHLGINFTTAFLFSVGVAGTVGRFPVLHQLLVHMLVTGLAALFVFSTLITARGLLGLLSTRLAAAAAAVLQFTFVAGMLCFLLYSVMSATTIRIPVSEVSWVPSFWFVGLYEVLLGIDRPAYGSLGERAIWGVAAASATALAVTLVSFPIQFQRALTPSHDPSSIGGSARMLCGIAWLAGARRPLARAAARSSAIARCRRSPRSTPRSRRRSLPSASTAPARSTRWPHPGMQCCGCRSSWSTAWRSACARPFSCRASSRRAGRSR
jgi:hypothetical protein